MAAEREELVADFEKLVNMSAGELREWLETDESRAAGDHGDGGESTGHRSGRRIVSLLERDDAEYSEADLEHMQRVRAYVKRHLAQRPSGEIEGTTWRHSLMNWGHDPLK